MLLEVHCHTAEHSPCSRAPAAQVAREALARNLQGVVLTDHHYRWEDRELHALRRESGVPAHFLLLAGQEVSTPDFGHVLVYGRTPSLAEGTPAVEIRERFPEAALVLAHPYRHRLEQRPAQLAPPVIDGVEIFSANHSMKANSRGLEDWHRHRFTALAGTDAHGQVDAGTYPTQFDHPVGDIDELAREIRRGRCRPLFKEITLSGANAQVTEIVIGTKGESERRPRIILRRLHRPADWEKAVQAADIGARIAAMGFGDGRFRVPEVLELDAGRMTVIEEGLRGRPLFEKLRGAGPAEGRSALESAAAWLARLHRLPLPCGPRLPFLGRERLSLEGYAGRFREAAHPRAALVCTLVDAVLAGEHRLLRRRPAPLVQCHGDFHPKNVIVGRDRRDDPGTTFVAAVDLADAIAGPRAFDVGSFLAHYGHQMEPFPEVLAALPGGIFLEAYLRECPEAGADFGREVEFFAARTRLSIASYLLKLGLGDSPALDRLLADCGRVVLGAAG